MFILCHHSWFCGKTITYCLSFILVANNSFIVLQFYDITLLVISDYSFTFLFAFLSLMLHIYRFLPYSRTSVNNWIKPLLINPSAPSTSLFNYMIVQLFHWLSNSCPKPPTFHLDPFLLRFYLTYLSDSIFTITSIFKLWLTCMLTHLRNRKPLWLRPHTDSLTIWLTPLIYKLE